MNVSCTRTGSLLKVAIDMGRERHLLTRATWPLVWGYVCGIMGVVPPLHDNFGIDPAEYPVHVPFTREGDVDEYVLCAKFYKMSDLCAELRVDKIVVTVSGTLPHRVMP